MKRYLLLLLTLVTLSFSSSLDSFNAYTPRCLKNNDRNSCEVATAIIMEEQLKNPSILTKSKKLQKTFSLVLFKGCSLKSPSLCLAVGNTFKMIGNLKKAERYMRKACNLDTSYCSFVPNYSDMSKECVSFHNTAKKECNKYKTYSKCLPYVQALSKGCGVVRSYDRALDIISPYCDDKNNAEACYFSSVLIGLKNSTPSFVEIQSSISYLDKACSLGHTLSCSISKKKREYLKMLKSMRKSEK